MRPDDMLYCTYQEVAEMVKGHPVSEATAIARRKRQRAQAAEYTLPDAWIGTIAPTKKAKVVEADADEPKEEEAPVADDEDEDDDLAPKPA